MEYVRLKNLFNEYSTSIVSVCCFRDPQSYKQSYAKQLLKQGIMPSKNKDSYRYLGDDSWLFDCPAKLKMLNNVFEETISFSYNREHNVTEFLDRIGYPSTCPNDLRLNVTEKSEKSEKSEKNSN